jgi:hypothetical protein
VKRSLLHAAALGAAVLLTATACGGDDDPTGSTRDALQAATSTPTSTATATATPTAPVPSATPTAEPETEGTITAEPAPEPVETEAAPPGDPGPDAPEVPDPGVPTDAPHEDAPLTTIPADAVLDAETLGAVVAGSWAKSPAPAAKCATPRPAGAAGELAVRYRSADGVFAETVSTYAGSAQADAAVAAFGKQLASCGWTATEAPTLGSSSVQATRGRETILMIAAEEGVTVTVRGSGSVTADPLAWESLADLAMGSSCPAAPDGCH